MSKSFEYQLKGEAAELINKAKAEARDNGVNMDGDSQTGNFSGLGIEGGYEVLEKKVVVKIEKKPMIMPWSLIQTKLDKFFS